jgi:hypothetical protein
VQKSPREFSRALLPGPDQNPGRTEGKVERKTVFDPFTPEVERFGVRTDADPAGAAKSE